MRPEDQELAKRLDKNLKKYSAKVRPLSGIEDGTRRYVLLEQLVESVRRIKFVSVLLEQEHDKRRADPHSSLFDPIRAAVIHKRNGNFDEAYWMVFLFVHFGKHPKCGWKLIRKVFGRLGDEKIWNWDRVTSNITEFRGWLAENQENVKRNNGSCGFGNHRKYQSLDAYSKTGTGTAIQSYIEWINPPRTHKEMINQILKGVEGDSRVAFDILYKEMDQVTSFGRLAKFDYLTMIGKLYLAPIEPGSTYISGSTGPLEGAKLLFGGNGAIDVSPRELDNWLIELGQYLNVGMQVLEDALCNWQKSPKKFVPFRA